MDKPKIKIKKNDHTMLLFAGGAALAVAAAAYFMTRHDAGIGVGEGDTTGAASGTYLNPYAGMFSFLQPTDGFSVHNWLARPGGAIADLLHPYGTPAPTNPLAPKTGGHYDLGFQPYPTDGSTPSNPDTSSGWTSAGSSSGGSFGVKYP